MKKQSEDKSLARFEESMDNYIIDTALKSQSIYDGLLEKAQRLQNKEEFDKETDEFILKVADSAWNHVHKTLDRKLKARLVKKEEVSMFHQLLKDANSGNKIDLDEIEIEDETKNN